MHQTGGNLKSFRCVTNCNHKECQKHAPLGIQDQNTMCSCIGDLNPSSIFLENVLDMSHSLAQIMILCGIHECKAKSAIDTITYAFLHYDQVCYCLDNLPKKRLRKEDLFHELGKKSLMNRVEAHLAYNIIKRGFKAFYYKPDESLMKDSEGRPTYADECAYVHAARKTAEAYARYDGLSCEEQRGFEAKMRVIYKKFYDRMKSRLKQPEGEECNCCFCAKKRGHMIYGKEAPCSSKQKRDQHTCPHCCLRKGKAARGSKMVHGSRISGRCPKCNKPRKYCTCEKYQFALNWIQSIWAQPDYNLYYRTVIEGSEQPELSKGGCSTTWMKAPWLEGMADLDDDKLCNTEWMEAPWFRAKD